MRLRTLIVALAVVVALMAPLATADAATGVQAAIQWLLNHQNPDGGFGTPASSPSATAQALLALSVPWEGVDTTGAVNAAVGYVVNNWQAYVSDAGSLGYLSLAFRAMGRSVRGPELGGHDLVTAIQGTYHPDTGLYGSYLYQHGLAVLGLLAAGENVPPQAVDRILSAQAPNGGWGWNGSGQDADSDTNTTAIMVQVLVALGREADPAVTKAVAFLADHTVESGGFAYQRFPETPLEADSNSTALVLQALLSADQDPYDPRWKDPVGALKKFQNSSGAFRWTDASPEDNLLSTVQAIPAVAQRYLPFSVVDATGKRSRVRAARPLPEAVTGADRIYFKETGHTLAYGFKSYWEAHGGLPVFGYPLTEEFDEFNLETGQKYTVQYFERACLEYHPELKGTPYEVEAGLLGKELMAALGLTFEPASPASPGIYFGASGHNVVDPFASFWMDRDGLRNFGLPLSEAFNQPESGTELTVQWFERARMELHPEAPQDWKVQLTHLGRLLLFGRR